MSSKFKSNALIPYITFGDPHIAFTEQWIQTCLDSGADAIEIGAPFSDPIADGPVIQASHQRALMNDPTLSFHNIFKMIQKFKQNTTVPFIIMTAVNLVYQYGIQAFFEAAKKNGVDAVVIPDLSVEESAVYHTHAQKSGVALALLLSPLCSAGRLAKIVNQTEGFLYLISSTGTTGQRALSTEGLAQIVQNCKKKKDIPVYVGFGVSAPEHVSKIWGFADGAIVGSFLVKIIADHLHNLDLGLEKVAEAITRLKKGV